MLSSVTVDVILTDIFASFPAAHTVPCTGWSRMYPIKRPPTPMVISIVLSSVQIFGGLNGGAESGSGVGNIVSIEEQKHPDGTRPFGCNG